MGPAAVEDHGAIQDDHGRNHYGPGADTGPGSRTALLLDTQPIDAEVAAHVVAAGIPTFTPCGRW